MDAFRRLIIFVLAAAGAGRGLLKVDDIDALCGVLCPYPSRGRETVREHADHVLWRIHSRRGQTNTAGSTSIVPSLRVRRAIHLERRIASFYWTFRQDNG